jgi:hypothetical protein
MKDTATGSSFSLYLHDNQLIITNIILVFHYIYSFAFTSFPLEIIIIIIFEKILLPSIIVVVFRKSKYN